ncbi:MAG: methylenetetrahydrofolate reductase [NAD(P)H] [Planctomycetota bacterium]|nr:MAG: methylenetetrahydrofolate reductase [NAD(P)H] [Planctomycetota bacterium]
MHIQDLFKQSPTLFSFEFFPPRSPEQAETLYEHMVRLEKLRPSFVSVTYGAGGTTRELTRDLVLRAQNQTGLTTVPHMTCVKQSEAELTDLIGAYARHGVSNILALRGDPPNGQPHDWGAERFRYASELVSFIKEQGPKLGHPDRRGFGVGVAGFPEGHPACPNRMLEMDYLKAKVDAGADFIITQMFFDNRDFYDFRDRCTLAGIRIPIIAGIMPVQSVAGMRRMAELALGMRYPAPMLRALRRTDGSDESIRRVGIHWATEQCRDLLDHGVQGIHFYTLNKSGATTEIYKTLGVSHSGQLLEGNDLGI